MLGRRSRCEGEVVYEICFLPSIKSKYAIATELHTALSMCQNRKITVAWFKKKCKGEKF